MFGTLRLILALMVAIYHGTNCSKVYGIGIGISAVVCFFIISGFVMTGLIRSYYWGKGTLSSFYLDRLMRLYPQYLFFMLLTIVMFWISGAWTELKADMFNFRFNLPVSNKEIFFDHLTVIPLDFYSRTHVGLILPAWSLGLEIQFYILLPFILKTFLRPYAIVYSIIIFSFASYGILDTEFFSYHLLWGTFFIFLSGSLIYDYVSGDKPILKYIIALFVIMVILFAVLSRESVDPIVKDVLIGYIVGIPLIFSLSLLKRRRFDEFMGNLSYGVFLSHVLVMQFSRHYMVFEPNDRIILFLSCSILLGFMGYYLVERPVVRFRRKMRQK